MSKSSKALRKKLKKRQRKSIDLVNRIIELKDAGSVVCEMQGVDIEEQIKRYKRIRNAGRRVNETLCAMIDSEGLRFSAQHLGILQDDTFVLSDESEMAVVFDHAIYNYRPSGMNAIERLAKESAVPEDLDEQTWLAGAQRSYHSVFLIVDQIRGFGIQARDVLTGQPVLIADINFSQCASIGLTIAARVLPMPDFCISSGTSLPIVDEHVLLTIADYLRRACGNVKDFRNLPRDRALLLESFIIRTCLMGGAIKRVRHDDGPV